MQCLNHNSEDCTGKTGTCRYESMSAHGERERLGRYQDHKFVGDGELCTRCGRSAWNTDHNWIGDVIVGSPA